METRALQGHALRVFVSRGGCSGCQYGMAFEPEPRADDIHLSQHGLELAIDPASLEVLRGMRIEDEEDFMGGGFRLENPNAVASCGCGSSCRTSCQPTSIAQDAEECC